MQHRQTDRQTHIRNTRHDNDSCGSTYGDTGCTGRKPVDEMSSSRVTAVVPVLALYASNGSLLGTLWGKGHCCMCSPLPLTSRVSLVSLRDTVLLLLSSPSPSPSPLLSPKRGEVSQPLCSSSSTSDSVDAMFAGSWNDECDAPRSRGADAIALRAPRLDERPLGCMPSPPPPSSPSPS